MELVGHVYEKDTDSQKVERNKRCGVNECTKWRDDELDNQLRMPLDQLVYAAIPWLIQFQESTDGPMSSGTVEHHSVLLQTAKQKLNI